MGVSSVLARSNLGRLTALSMVVESALAFLRGNKHTAALLFGAAVLAYRWSWVGIVAELGIRVYQWTR